MVDKVELSRYEITGRLGIGADYEVKLATDRETGQEVALKRPVPQVISRRQHDAIEARTGRRLRAYQEALPPAELVVPILGYTERGVHDDVFGDDLREEYTVVVQEMARGIPLLGDMMSKIRGVPIAAGQNLFAVFPLVQNPATAKFPVHNQLLDLQQVYLDAGYVVLDLRPQNIFYQPKTGEVSVIDTGTLAGPHAEAPRGRPPYDVNDACLELIKFYTTPEEPPEHADVYREAKGIRPIMALGEEIDQMLNRLALAGGSVESAGRIILEKIAERAYIGYGQFRTDLNVYLQTLQSRDAALPAVQTARNAWLEALEWLRGDYWKRFLFDADGELEGYRC